MATTVSSIISATKAILIAKLGVNWQEMRNPNDIEKNDLRTGARSYGVRPLDAANAPTVTNAYMLSHLFEIVLMNTVPRQDNSDQATAVVADLYDKQDEVFKEMARQKLNLPTTIIDVFEPTLAAPEFVKGGAFVALRQQVRVKYRQLL